VRDVVEHLDDPADGAPRRVWVGGHEALDQATKRLDPGGLLDPVEQVVPVNVPGGDTPGVVPLLVRVR
jgi:hypothetical protein